jgi:glycosyltransferase involved in cell wall biosynthesis
VTGVQRYAINILITLEKVLSKNENLNVVVLIPKASKIVTLISLERVNCRKIGFLSGHLWEQFELPIYTRNQLLVNLCNSGPIFKRKQFVVIHDTAIFRFPQAYKKGFVLWYKIMMRINSKLSSMIITVSQFSKSELIRFLSIEEQKIFIVPPALSFFDTFEDKSIISKLNLHTNKYVLAVGSLDFKKNLINAVKAFKLLKEKDLELVLVGAANNEVFKNVFIESAKGVKITGYILDSELIALYRNATLFVYPSYYEGFGLPPLEAMAFDCPVVVSKVASLPEVCGDAVLYCDPADVDTIVNAMRRIINDSELKQSLVAKGRLRIHEFSYERSVENLLKLFLSDNSK